jgi:hypothetical protein
MAEEYSKIVTGSEFSKRFIRIAREGRLILPRVGTKFEVVVSNRTINVQVDPYGRIWEAEIYKALRLRPGDTVTFSKSEEGKIFVSKKTEPSVTPAK